MNSKLSYREVLLEIDRLRASGLKDSDPKIKSLKRQLWDHLEKKRKKKEQKSSVPTVMAVRTVKLDSSTLGKKDKTLASTSNPEPQKPYAKYFLLGVVLAIIIVGYKLLNKD